MLSQQIKDSGTLLDSIDALRNWRAVLLLLVTLVASALVMGLGTLLAGVGTVFVAVFALAAYAVLFYGVNAVGILLMDEARGLPSMSMLDAIAQSLASSHRLIVVYLLLAALYLAGLVLLALVLVVCKLPFLGPMLYAAVFPVSVALAGVALFALPVVVFPLSAPAVWNGASAMECATQLVAIARRRLLMVLVLMLAVAFIAGMVALLLGAVLFTGAAVTAGVSAPILGSGDTTFGGMGAFGMGAAGSYATAAGLGGGVLFAAAFTLPGLVYLQGVSMVYLRAVDGLDLATEQAFVAAHLTAARDKARAVQAQAQAHAQQVAERARAAAASAAAPAAESAVPNDIEGVQDAQRDPTPTPLRCPQCATPVQPRDTYCAACGSFLK